MVFLDDGDVVLIIVLGEGHKLLRMVRRIDKKNPGIGECHSNLAARKFCKGSGMNVPSDFHLPRFMKMNRAVCLSLRVPICRAESYTPE